MTCRKGCCLLKKRKKEKIQKLGICWFALQCKVTLPVTDKTAMLKNLREKNQMFKPMRKRNSSGHPCDLNLVSLSGEVFIILSWMFLFTGPLESDPTYTGVMELFSLTSVSFRLGSKWPLFFPCLTHISWNNIGVYNDKVYPVNKTWSLSWKIY